MMMAGFMLSVLPAVSHFPSTSSPAFFFHFPFVPNMFLSSSQ
jgi:hypothetical protein